MKKREPLLTEDFFVNRLAYLDRIIAERNEKLIKRPEVYILPKEFLWSNFRGRYQQIFLGYSIGETVPEQLEIKLDGRVVVSASVSELRDSHENALESALRADPELVEAS